MEKTFNELTYVICHNGADVIHPAKMAPGATLSSGQPYVEEFETEEQWKKRLKELKFDTSTLEPATLVAPQELGPIAENLSVPATRREMRKQNRN